MSTAVIQKVTQVIPLKSALVKNSSAKKEMANEKIKTKVSKKLYTEVENVWSE